MRVIDRLLGLACLTALSAPLGAAQAQEAVSLVGTWGSKVSTTADFTVPLVGATTANVTVALRLDVREEGGQLVSDVELCQLNTDSPSLTVDYTKVVQYLKTQIAIPAGAVAPGTKLPLPDINITVGQDAAGLAVDTDGDTKPGVTLPSKALGTLALDAYAGLKLSLKLDATVQNATSITGTGLLNTVGTIFGSSFPLLTGGAINVSQKTPAAFTAKHFAGSVSCADLLPQL
ncbi:MAG: hypothetical protein ABW252_24535 [Polyangiales bacterium]